MVGLISPALALGAILSTAYAALFHLWQKGELPALRRFLLAGWLGFAAGHFLGEMVGLGLVRIGQLDILTGTIGALIALVIAKTLEA